MVFRKLYSAFLRDFDTELMRGCGSGIFMFCKILLSRKRAVSQGVWLYAEKASAFQ